MISGSGTRKSSDANVLAVKRGFDFARRSAGFSEVFRLPLPKMPVFRKSSDFRYERCQRLRLQLFQPLLERIDSSVDFIQSLDQLVDRGLRLLGRGDWRGGL